MPPATELVRALRRAGQTVACCESLTAGLLSATIAGVPGASHVLRGGLVTYATDLKESLAGVDAAVLEQHGPVAAETAEQMARGARRVCGADWALALTGVAGPEAQDGHPVGEVFLGVTGPDGVVESVRVAPPGRSRWALCPHETIPVPVVVGDRAEIRAASVDFALSELLRRVREQTHGKVR